MVKKKQHEKFHFWNKRKALRIYMSYKWIVLLKRNEIDILLIARLAKESTVVVVVQEAKEIKLKKHFQH